MALLRRGRIARGVRLAAGTRVVPLALALGLGCAALSCEELEPTGKTSVRIYDEAVVCHEHAGCLSQTQTQVPSEDHNVAAYISRQASRYGDGGLYVYFEIRRTSGAVVLVELDVPTTNRAGATARAPHYIYREYKGGKKIFDATRVRGKVEVPISSTCPCQDGRLELEFTDLGPDKVHGTLDDRVRRLSRGYFGLISSSCRYARLTSIGQQKARVEVAGIGHCPGKSSAPDNNSSSSGSSGYYYDDHDHYVGCTGYPEDDDYYYEDTDETGCGGDDTYQEEDYSGCEGDSWDSGDSADFEGCEADSSDFGDGGGCEGDSADIGSGGCEGDSSSADMSCEGDAWAGVPGQKMKRRRPPQWQQALGMVPPFLFLGMVHAFMKRRSRRKRMENREPGTGN